MSHYVNARFGFIVRHPREARVIESENGDGACITIRDDLCVRLWAGHNINEIRDAGGLIAYYKSMDDPSLSGFRTVDFAEFKGIEFDEVASCAPPVSVRRVLVWEATLYGFSLEDCEAIRPQDTRLFDEICRSFRLIQGIESPVRR